MGNFFTTSARALLISIALSCAPSPDEPFESALPILVVDTHATNIEKDAEDDETPFFTAEFKLWAPAAGQTMSWTETPTFVGQGGIRVRGNSSREFDKKQYRLETWTPAGEDTDVSWLGLPEEEDWILHGPFADKTLMRNHLMYQWSRAIGRYAARSVFVELYVEDDGGALSTDNYRGVYLMMEKLKRDSGRIDVAKLKPEDIELPELTGGYVLKRDWAEAGEPGTVVTETYDDLLIIEYPKPETIAPEQRAYIVRYLDDMEAALASPDFADPTTGYAAWIDVGSFIDHHLLVELGRNVDGFVLSTFMHKDRGGLLTMGPIWDYNGALGNADYFEASSPEGWHHKNPEFPEDNPNGYRWYARLFEDPAFRSRYRARWTELRAGPLATDTLLGDIDAVATQLAGGPLTRNFERWEVLGQYVWPNDEGAEDRETYDEELAYLKQWLRARLTWMDQELL
jgi:hypothetical protein